MVSLILGLAVIGLVLYVIERYVPMDSAIRTILRVVVVLVVLWYLWQVFALPDLPLPHYR
jgi:hypothetical protein